MKQLHFNQNTPTLRPLALGLIAAGLLSAATLARADSSDERIRKLESQVKALQDQVELNQKESVVGGDIPGSLRLPGSETSAHIYGYVGGHLIHDFKNNSGDGGGNDIFTWTPGQNLGNSGEQGVTRMTAKDSRLGFETATPTKYGAFTTKIEGDFNRGDQNGGTFRLRHAYGEYAGLLIGQTWSNFMDLDNTPETVDFNGPIGTPFERVPMIRYAYDLPNVAKFTIALEDPIDGEQKHPNVVARIDRSFSWGGVNLRAMSSDFKSANNKFYTGHGVGLGANFKLTDNTLLMAQFTGVMGGDMGSGWALLGANKAVYDDTSGNVAKNKAAGWVVGASQTINSAWRSNILFSRTLNNDSNSYLALADDGTLNKRVTQYHVNVIYTPIKNIDLGVEYVGGKRETYDAQVGRMSRLDIMGKYSF